MDRSIIQNSDQAILLVTFVVGEGQYGLDANRVQEVVLVGKITPVHHAPEYVKGVINLRGKIVSVLDLATKLDTDIISSEVNRILIVRWLDEYVGLLVEQVGDVLTIDKSQIRPAPANLRELLRKYTNGIYQEGDRVYSILDLDAVMGDN